MILGSLLLKYLRLERHFKPLLILFAPLEEKRISFGGVEHLVHLFEFHVFPVWKQYWGATDIGIVPRSLLAVPSVVITHNQF